MDFLENNASNDSYTVACVKLKLKLITNDSQSASQSWCQTSIWDPRPIFLSPWNFLWTLAGLLFCSARGRACNLLSLLVLPSAVPLWSESRGTQEHILLSQFLRLPQPEGPSPRIYIPQGQGCPDIPPGTGFPFHWLLRLAGLRWRYSIPPPHGIAYVFIAAVTFLPSRYLAAIRGMYI
jgi:hypothetical protein